MIFRSVLKRILSKDTPEQAESHELEAELRPRPAKTTNQNELVELFGSELRDHESLSDLKPTRSPKY